MLRNIFCKAVMIRGQWLKNIFFLKDLCIYLKELEIEGETERFFHLLFTAQSGH